jgi:glycosyltransferase involved in cell wall biosynthesis
MLKCSLVIATYGRVAVLEDLFESLTQQGAVEIECIVVDQNPDDRLAEILERWQQRLTINHLRSAPGLSRARNLGLQHVTGEVVAFPDDDCWYTPKLLEKVCEWFKEHPGFRVLTVGAVDRTGAASGNRWLQDQCEIKAVNAFRTTFSPSLFLLKTNEFPEAWFDEVLGVGGGTPYSSGEETDYVLKLLKMGVRGYFDRSMKVGHPKRDMLSGSIEGERAMGYGRGMGYVLRKHSMLFLSAAFVTYDMLRSALVAAKGDLRASSLCVQHARGIASGYTARQPGGEYSAR